MKIKNIDSETNFFKKKYPWLNITTTIEEYVEATYYEKLLKEYKFNNKTDLQIFEDYLKNNDFNNKQILELGCGSGRATKLLFNNIKNIRLDILDLSTQMLEFTKERFLNKKINVINSDTIDYLYNSEKNYDFVYSLWSYSHSVHQHLTKYGIDKGSKYISKSLNKFINQNLNKEGKMFIIHFDSLSDEQKILIKQWKKVYPIFENNCIQSPSLNLTNKILEQLKQQNVLDFRITHLPGNEIVYDSLDEALEIFMNFHMESYFNKTALCFDVIKELIEYFEKFRIGEKIIIKPGCFIIEVIKK